MNGNKLKIEIDRARQNVITDSYPMSIGEMVNLYEDGELDINPAFQRVYRWSDAQKSSLIESILLGIPLPSIFVAQREDGVWDVVDGLQRLSTIFEFQGILKHENGERLNPIKLLKTKYLPSLENHVWDKSLGIFDSDTHEVSIEIKRIFKREKIDVKIIKRESDDDAKLELFQRLNTGGTKLSDQEVRNCIILMINTYAFEWLKELCGDENFWLTTPMTERKMNEAFAEELVIRFLVVRHGDESVRRAFEDVHPYLDAEVTRLFKKEHAFDFIEEKRIFEEVFSILSEALGEDAFRKYDHMKSKYQGAFSLPMYEAMISGVSKYLEENPSYNKADLITIIQSKSRVLTDLPRFKRSLGVGSRPIERMKIMKELGRELF